MKKNKKTKVIKKFKNTSKANTGKESNVYIYYNIKTKDMLFTDAWDLDEACDKFDACEFSKRKEWKIFLEVGCQPN